VFFGLLSDYSECCPEIIREASKNYSSDLDIAAPPSQTFLFCAVLIKEVSLSKNLKLQGI
jgi:hypothetical protein